MKITFIVPAIGKKQGQRYIGTWKMEPLTVAVLSSLTPANVERELFDDRIELIDYDTKTDLAAITVETYTAKRSYRIAEEFRRRHVPVVLGGYHVTLNPEEAQEHADSVVTGNAEGVWGQVVEDACGHRLRKLYRGENGFSRVLPDRGIYRGKKYLPVSLVEIGRGCGHQCEFCAIAGYYGSRHYSRDIEQIIMDIGRAGNKYHFLVDDNLGADMEYAKRLFERLIPLQIKWAGQGTLALARDRELLRLMKRSGCELMLIGFESVSEQNLKQMNKSWLANVGERDELVERFHVAGIGIYATFLFGYDNDNPGTFQDSIRFAERHNFYAAAFNHLLPFPGTPLYSRLRRDRRLAEDAWWLADGYRYGQLAFDSGEMSAGRISAMCRMARKRFSSFPVILQRGFTSMKRTSPAAWFLFWAMNLRLGEEIEGKFDIPVGSNLDELPK